MGDGMDASTLFDPTLDTPSLFDLARPAKDSRIVVAMSGGVDSSVVAALAASTGAEVIGITLQLYDYGAATGRKGACCAGDDISDARAVSDRLGIAHYVFHHERAFRQDVVEQFADDYLAGRTPLVTTSLAAHPSCSTAESLRHRWPPLFPTGHQSSP